MPHLKRPFEVGDFVFLDHNRIEAAQYGYNIPVLKKHLGVILSINEWDEVKILTVEGESKWGDLKDLTRA
jgi:hypothetical protein